MLLKKSFLIVCIFTLSALNALTLKEALESSISIAPEIMEKQKRYEEIYYDVEMAKSGYLPKLDFLGTSLLYDERIKKAGEKAYDVELMLTQNLFSGFGDISKHQLELSKYKSALFTIKELKNKFSLQVIQAYLNLLREKNMLEIQQSSIKNHESILEKIKIKYNAGLGNRLELRLSQTSLYLAQLNYHEQKNTIQQSKITFEKYMNKIVDASSLVYPQENIDLPDTFEKALKIALANHPSMHVAKLNKEITDYELEYTKKDLYPSLDLEANYYTGQDGIYKNGINEYYDVNLKLSYNIFNGNYDISAKRKIEQKIAQKQALIQKAKLDIKNKLKSKYDAYLMLKAKVILLDNYVTSKELTLESYYAEFSIGKARLSDILDTTESLYAARKIQLDGKFDLLISKYSVLEAMGVLPKISYLYNNTAKIVKTKEIEINKSYDDANITKKEIDKSKKQAKGDCYKVNATTLNIRKERSSSSQITGRYIDDEIICAQEENNMWIKTHDGWVSKTYLKNTQENNK